MEARRETIDARREIEGLVAFEGRTAGSDAERRAAGHLKRRLEGLGRQAEVESVEIRPAYHVTYALQALLAILGSVLAVLQPAFGAALVALAVVSTFGDATGLFFLARRLTGRRASQNVVSREDDAKQGRLVLVAHYDTPRGGAVFGRRVTERRAALGKLLRRPIGLLEPLFGSMLLILACAALRLLGVENLLVTTVQFLATVVLIVSLPLLADVALSDPVPGANDNASGVSTALRLAERYGGRLQHFDTWVLLTGSEEAFALGMRSWLKRHRKELARDRTVFVNVNEVGVGTVRFTRREGLLFPTPSHVQVLALCEEIAEDDEEQHAFGARPLVSRTVSDGYAARSAGFAAITVSCRNALDYVSDHHQGTDTTDRVDDAALERAYGFCCELIERLDAQVGPGLAL